MPLMKKRICSVTIFLAGAVLFSGSANAVPTVDLSGVGVFAKSLITKAASEADARSFLERRFRMGWHADPQRDVNRLERAQDRRQRQDHQSSRQDRRDRAIGRNQQERRATRENRRPQARNTRPREPRPRETGPSDRHPREARDVHRQTEQRRVHRNNRGNTDRDRRYDGHRDARRDRRYDDRRYNHRRYDDRRRRENRTRYRVGPRGGRAYGHGHGPRSGHGYFCDLHAVFHYYAGFDPYGWRRANHRGRRALDRCRIVERIERRRGRRVIVGAQLCYDRFGYSYIRRGSSYVYRPY